MCVALAREIRDGDIVFHGLASPVPMTAMKLAKALGKDFTYLNITGGVDPGGKYRLYRLNPILQSIPGLGGNLRA